MSNNPAKILLVEDNTKDLKLTLLALQEENVGNEIVVARDGQEALDYIFCQAQYRGRDPEPPRLILLDLKLPKVDGLEVLRAVKGNPQTRAIPVVVLTSSKEEHDLTESYQIGTNAYIQKPVDFDQFRDVVKQLGMFWLLVNEAPPTAAFR